MAVSGGPDSLALLLLAHAARPGSIIAATVDHGLRPEARAEADLVGLLCADLGVPHAILTVTVADDPAGPQAAARDARYRALASWAEREGAVAIATGHQLDDQAETVLMRLARGSGIGGLSGMPARRALDRATLIRPLLSWRRKELAAIVAAAGITAIDDPSNHNPRFDRTTARALLEVGWPDPKRLAASADHLAEAEEALAWACARLAAERLHQDAASVSIDVEDLPREFLRRLVLTAFARLGTRPKRGDELDRLIDRVAGGAVSTLAGVRVAPGARWRFTKAKSHRVP
nr:tRNA lysidine(34) synthetase TilS [Sphingomonas vulcanisoli]